MGQSRVDTTPSNVRMGNTAVISGVTVMSVILVTVAVTILVYCLYQRKKLPCNHGNKHKTEGRRIKTVHGSSTMRSDKSDHPYESPSLPRTLNANLKSSMLGDDQSSDPYVNLRGQSLPHHYQDLGQKTQLTDGSEYDELMVSTERTTSDYYFKLEPGSLKNPGLRLGVDPPAMTTDPDQAYDLVEIGNMTGNRSNSNKDHESIRDERGNGDNPYYFKVERSKGGSPTIPTAQQPCGKYLSSEKGDEAVPKPAITNKSNLASKTKASVEKYSSYDKLDRSALRTQKSEDLNANEYNKLSPRLATSSNALSSDGEVYDYNKLDRGVEIKIKKIVGADK